MADPGSPAATGSSRMPPRPNERAPALSLPATALLVGGLALRVGPTAARTATRRPWPPPDPDQSTERGRARQRPLIVGSSHLVFQLPMARSRPRAEKIELAVNWGLLTAMTAAAIAMGRFGRNRVGSERPVAPPLRHQKHRVAHRPHPRIAFHRYVAARRCNEEEYLAHDPPLTDVRGRTLSLDEYRRRRALAGRRASGGEGVSTRTGWGGRRA
jgi:hypothetical protein